MDTLSVVSSASLNRSFDFHTRKSSNSGGANSKSSSASKSAAMVQKKWTVDNSSNGGGGGGGGGRRPSYQRSEISVGTDLSAERPCTRDTASLLMRDASVLSSQPDKSNFREKMQSWAVYEDNSSPYMAPRPTTSLADQKPSNSLNHLMMNDIEREMSFLMSRPSTTFPSKPKELVEPLEGMMPDERPVSQKKFFVLPSIGHRHPGDFVFRRQRSNLETINQLDYSRNRLEEDVHFFSDYYNHHLTTPSPTIAATRANHHNNPNIHHHHHHQHKHQHVHIHQDNNNNHGGDNSNHSSHTNNHHRQQHQQQKHFSPMQNQFLRQQQQRQQQRLKHNNDTSTQHNQPRHHDSIDDDDDSDTEETTSLHINNAHRDPRQSPTKTGKTGTPMPLPPIHKMKLRSTHPYLTELAEENMYAMYSRGESRISSECSLEDDDEELEAFRLKTPETYRSTDSPIKNNTAITPPPEFR